MSGRTDPNLIWTSAKISKQQLCTSLSVFTGEKVVRVNTIGEIAYVLAAQGLTR